MTNQELAKKLTELRDFLIIAGYEESHATRYTHIARAIEKLPEPVQTLRDEGRLTEIPQVGKLVAQYIREIIDTGVSSKQQEWESEAPYSVVEMCRVPGLGAKTAKTLFQAFGIQSLAQLKASLAKGDLDKVLSARVRAAVSATD